MATGWFASKLSDLSRQVIHWHRCFLYLDLCNHACLLNVFLTSSLLKSKVSATHTRFTSLSCKVNPYIGCFSSRFTEQYFADYSSQFPKTVRHSKDFMDINPYSKRNHLTLQIRSFFIYLAMRSHTANNDSACERF